MIFGSEKNRWALCFRQYTLSVRRLLDSNYWLYERVVAEDAYWSWKGHSEQSLVLNELTSGIEDPKSGGRLVMKRQGFIKFTLSIKDPRSEGRLVYCLGQ